jgi:hypothetical protein
VFFLQELAAELDLSEIHAYYRQTDLRGEKANDPRMTVLLLLYASCVGPGGADPAPCGCFYSPL